MQELTFEQVEVVSGGSKIEDMRRAQAAREADKQLNGNDGGNSIDYINVASDVLTLGMAGARLLTMSTPLGWGLLGVTAAYYGGQWLGEKIVGSDN